MTGLLSREQYIFENARYDNEIVLISICGYRGRNERNASLLVFSFLALNNCPSEDKKKLVGRLNIWISQIRKMQMQICSLQSYSSSNHPCLHFRYEYVAGQSKTRSKVPEIDEKWPDVGVLCNKRARLWSVPAGRKLFSGEDKVFRLSSPLLLLPRSTVKVRRSTWYFEPDIVDLQFSKSCLIRMENFLPVNAAKYPVVGVESSHLRLITVSIYTLAMDILKGKQELDTCSYNKTCS